MTNNWMKIAEWIENSKKAKLVDPPDDGRPVRTGERYSEHSQDIKNITGQHNVDSAPENPEDGRSDNFGEGHGLQQVTADKKIKGQDKIKVVHDANLKASQVLAKGEEATLDELVEAVDALRNAYDSYIYGSNYKSASYNYPQVDQNYYQNELSSFDFIKKAGAEVVNEYMSYGKLNADILYSFLSGFSNEYYNLKQAAANDQLAEYISADPYTNPRVADMIRTLVKMAETGMADQILNTVAGPTAGDTEGTPPPIPPSRTRPGDSERAKGEEPPESEEETDSAEQTVTDDDLAAAAAELGLSPEDLMDLLRVIQERLEQPESPAETGMATEREVENVPSEKNARDYRYSRLVNFKKRAARRAFASVRSLFESTVDKMVSGEFRLKPAADGSAERIRREIAKQYLNELLNIALS